MAIFFVAAGLAADGAQAPATRAPPTRPNETVTSAPPAPTGSATLEVQLTLPPDVAVPVTFFYTIETSSSPATPAFSAIDLPGGGTRLTVPIPADARLSGLFSRTPVLLWSASSPALSPEGPTLKKWKTVSRKELATDNTGRIELKVASEDIDTLTQVTIPLPPGVRGTLISKWRFPAPVDRTNLPSDDFSSWTTPWPESGTLKVPPGTYRIETTGGRAGPVPKEFTVGNVPISVGFEPTAFSAHPKIRFRFTGSARWDGTLAYQWDHDGGLQPLQVDWNARASPLIELSKPDRLPTEVTVRLYAYPSGGRRGALAGTWSLRPDDEREELLDPREFCCAILESQTDFEPARNALVVADRNGPRDVKIENPRLVAHGWSQRLWVPAGESGLVLRLSEGGVTGEGEISTLQTSGTLPVVEWWRRDFLFGAVRVSYETPGDGVLFLQPLGSMTEYDERQLRLMPRGKYRVMVRIPGGEVRELRSEFPVYAAVERKPNDLTIDGRDFNTVRIPLVRTDVPPNAQLKLRRASDVAWRAPTSLEKEGDTLRLAPDTWHIGYELDADPRRRAEKEIKVVFGQKTAPVQFTADDFRYGEVRIITTSELAGQLTANGRRVSAAIANFDDDSISITERVKIREVEIRLPEADAVFSAGDLRRKFRVRGAARQVVVLLPPGPARDAISRRYADQQPDGYFLAQEIVDSSQPESPVAISPPDGGGRTAEEKMDLGARFRDSTREVAHRDPSLPVPVRNTDFVLRYKGVDYRMLWLPESNAWIAMRPLVEDGHELINIGRESASNLIADIQYAAKIRSSDLDQSGPLAGCRLVLPTLEIWEEGRRKWPADFGPSVWQWIKPHKNDAGKIDADVVGGSRASDPAKLERARWRSTLPDRDNGYPHVGIRLAARPE